MKCLKCLCKCSNQPAGGRSMRFPANVARWRMTLRRADPASTQPRSFPGRVGPQQKHCDRFNLWRLGFTIAIHPLIRQHFVEIYHCHWPEVTLSRWIGELWTRMIVSNRQICLSSPLPSFIVALFCAAAIFNRLVLHSHPCRLTVPKAEKGGKMLARVWVFYINFQQTGCQIVWSTTAVRSPGLSRLFLKHKTGS